MLWCGVWTSVCVCGIDDTVWLCILDRESVNLWCGWNVATVKWFVMSNIGTGIGTSGWFSVKFTEIVIEEIGNNYKGNRPMWYNFGPLRDFGRIMWYVAYPHWTDSFTFSRGFHHAKLPEVNPRGNLLDLVLLFDHSTRGLDWCNEWIFEYK